MSSRMCRAPSIVIAVDSDIPGTPGSAFTEYPFPDFEMVIVTLVGN